MNRTNHKWMFIHKFVWSRYSFVRLIMQSMSYKSTINLVATPVLKSHFHFFAALKKLEWFFFSLGWKSVGFGVYFKWSNQKRCISIQIVRYRTWNGVCSTWSYVILTTSVLFINGSIMNYWNVNHKWKRRKTFKFFHCIFSYFY